MSKSLSTIYNRTGKTALKIKAKQEEYLHDGARFYTVRNDQRTALCVDFDTGSFSICNFHIVRTTPELQINHKY
jgi:hypothetical protein